MQIFSYCPHSGSRVLVAQPAPTVVIAYPGPGVICAGDIVSLTYSAATPGAHWRGRAVRIASQIVEAVGGLAEDNQGGVTVCVPVLHAFRAHQLMSFAGELPAEEDANMRRLLSAECLRVGPDLRLVDASHSLPRLHEKYHYGWYADGRTYVGCGDACPHCEGTDCSTECRCTSARPMLCPVRLWDGVADDGDAVARHAVRFGLYSDGLDRWVRVWADLHNGGRTIPVRPYGGTTFIAHPAAAVTAVAGKAVTWDEGFVRTINANGDIAPTAAAEATS